MKKKLDKYRYGDRTTQVWWCGSAVVSVRAWEPRVPGLNLRYPLTTFQYLIPPPSGQRLSKLLPYCSQTGLTMLYAFEALAVISLSSFSTYSSENINFRGVTIKNLKKSTPNNRQRQVHLCLHKSLLAPTVYDIEEKQT